MILICFYIITLNGQDTNIWNGKKCAVSLTYDDALNVHLDNVVPLLDSLGFRATFYIAGSFPGVQPRLADWKNAAGKGNELGNHTLFHPCEGGYPGREWVKPEYDLNTYTMRRMVDEIETANSLLSAIDGKTKRTFAYPCGETMIGDSSYVPVVNEKFVGARGGAGQKLQTIDEIDVYGVCAFSVADQFADELIGLVKKAVEKNALLVFVFHGVGGEHSINVPLEVHNKLISYLKQNENEIWVAPMVEITEYIKEFRQN
jgi:sialate O-acetylesterase